MRRTIVSLILVLVGAASVSLPVQPQSPAKREIVADVAFEFYVGEGTTRYLAVFYGEMPKASIPDANGAMLDHVGPIRSGRLPYIQIRNAFQWSCLAFASATPEIRAQLLPCYTVNGADPNDVNSAFVNAAKMKEIAAGNLPPRVEFGIWVLLGETGRAYASLERLSGARRHLDIELIFYSEAASFRA